MESNTTILLNEKTAEKTFLSMFGDRIFITVLNKNHKELKILLSLAKINEIISEDMAESTLNLAASQGDEVSVELLLTHGVIPDYNRPVHIWPDSTLSRAIISGNHKVIQLLVNYGCNLDVTLKISQSPVNLGNDPYTYWHKIVEEDNLSIFKLLLKCKGRKIGKNKWSQNLLLSACSLGASEIVEFMLDHDVPIESTDKKSWTCIFHAVVNWRILIIQRLITRGANLKHKDFMGRSILHILILYAKVAHSRMEPLELIKLLIDKGADINATDINGQTLINTTVTTRYVGNGIMDYFSRRSDIDFSKPDIYGFTFLHNIIFLNKCNSLSFNLFRAILCRTDVDINAQDKQGRTPLQLISSDDLIRLDVLLDFGADTKVLKNLKQDTLEDEHFLKVLVLHQLKRRAANLGNDSNIDTLLAKHRIFSMEECIQYDSIYSNEIKRMKETILCDKLTYYDFLHAKRRTLMNVAKRPGMDELFIKLKHDFDYYGNILLKNYAHGLQPLTPIETKAIVCAEMNLDAIFINKLPNLVTYFIKKFIDIEDMMTLENVIS